jgi:hypothetical protein
LGKGLNDGDIAKELNLTEVNVKNCVVWLIHFFKGKGSSGTGDIRASCVVLAPFFYRRLYCDHSANGADVRLSVGVELFGIAGVITMHI